MTHNEARTAAARVRQLSQDHHKFRAGALNLGCAEMLTSPLVREMLATDFGRRYGTKRGYSGGAFLDAIELTGEELARRLFGAMYAILSPITGHVALMATLLALTDRGDTIMNVAGEDGGYPMAIAEKFGLRTVPHAFDRDAMNIDVARTSDLILAERPRVIWLGAARYLFAHPVRELRAVCDEIGALICYDASHPLGLIAGGAFHDPFAEGADVMIGSTSKTLFGPARGIILVRRDEALRDRVTGVFEDFLLQSTYQLNGLAALVVALAESAAFGASFARQTIENAKHLARALSDRQVPVLGMAAGGSDSHQVLLASGWTGGKAARTVQRRLERAGIMCDRFLRLGVQQITRQGVQAEGIEFVAEMVSQAYHARDSDRKLLDSVRSRVSDFAGSYTTLRYTFDDRSEAFSYVDFIPNSIDRPPLSSPIARRVVGP